MCRSKKSKMELLRIVRSPEGVLLIDPSGRALGRGVYLCKTRACGAAILAKQKKSPIAYFLKVSIPPVFFDTLKSTYDGFPQ